MNGTQVGKFFTNRKGLKLAGRTNGSIKKIKGGLMSAKGTNIGNNKEDNYQRGTKVDIN